MSWLSEVGNAVGDVGGAIGDAWLWFNAARVGAAAALGALGLAAISTYVGVGTLRQTRRDSKAKARPTISAELRAVEYTHGAQSLVIRNTGPSIAKDVQVTFDPPIPMPENPERLVTPIMLRRYSKPIPVMTPGMELDNLYYAAQSGPDGNTMINGEPVPEVVTVIISYSSDDGDRYTDRYPLDVDLLRARTYQTSSAAPEAQLKEAVKTMKSIDGSLKSLAQSGEMATEEQRAERRAAVMEQRKALDAAWKRDHGEPAESAAELEASPTPAEPETDPEPEPASLLDRFLGRR